MNKRGSIIMEMKPHIVIKNRQTIGKYQYYTNLKFIF